MQFFFKIVGLSLGGFYTTKIQRNVRKRPICLDFLVLEVVPKPITAARTFLRSTSSAHQASKSWLLHSFMAIIEETDVHCANCNFLAWWPRVVLPGPNSAHPLYTMRRIKSMILVLAPAKPGIFMVPLE